MYELYFMYYKGMKVTKSKCIPVKLQGYSLLWCRKTINIQTFCSEGMNFLAIKVNVKVTSNMGPLTKK